MYQISPDEETVSKTVYNAEHLVEASSLPQDPVKLRTNIMEF